MGKTLKCQSCSRCNSAPIISTSLRGCYRSDQKLMAYSQLSTSLISCVKPARALVCRACKNSTQPQAPQCVISVNNPKMLKMSRRASIGCERMKCSTLFATLRTMFMANLDDFNSPHQVRCCEMTTVKFTGVGKC